MLYISSWATKKLYIKKTGAYKGTIKGYHNQSNNSWLTPEGKERKASNVMDQKKKLASL